MEAPEKIFLFENPINGTPDYRWLSKRSCSDDVEYVRKDALVEKAATWFANRYQANGSYLNTDDIEDFIKTMRENKL